jgi:hypothetical protein
VLQPIVQYGTAKKRRTELTQMCGR